MTWDPQWEWHQQKNILMTISGWHNTGRMKISPCNLVLGRKRNGVCYVVILYICMEPSVSVNMTKYARLPVLSTESMIELVQLLFVWIFVGSSHGPPVAERHYNYVYSVKRPIKHQAPGYLLTVTIILTSSESHQNVSKHQNSHIRTL